jgi:DeoR family transcriptional regulator, fructose operon transcriptional repressor
VKNWEHSSPEELVVDPGDLQGPSAANAGRRSGSVSWKNCRVTLEPTVVTNSSQVAEVLYGGTADQTVVLIGGVRTPSDALVGPLAVNALRQLHLDIVFMGVHGMDVRSGFTTPNLLEADANRAFVNAARQLAVVADHTKWGVLGISTIAALEDADLLVTDESMPKDVVRLLADRVSNLVIASVDESRS